VTRGENNSVVLGEGAEVEESWLPATTGFLICVRTSRQNCLIGGGESNDRRVVLAKSNQMVDILPRVPECLAALDKIKAGEILHVGG